MGLFSTPEPEQWQYTQFYCTNNSHGAAAPKATVICIKCNHYLCAACNTLMHKPNTPDHTSAITEVSLLRSYIVLSPQPAAGESHVHRHLKAPKGPDAFDWRYNGCSTLYETHARAVRLQPDARMLGTRTMTAATATTPAAISSYHWESYASVYARCNNIASALLLLGCSNTSNTRVGLYSINRAEWTISEYASYMHSLVPVPLYDTLGPETAEYIIGQAEVKVVFCSFDKLASLLEIATRVNTLTAIVVMKQQVFDAAPATAAGKQLLAQLNSSSSSNIKSNNATVYTFAALELMGSKQPAPHHPPTAESTVTLCYTSGTTGMPKGVILTHKNMVSNISAIHFHSSNVESVSSSDTGISYLPLAHIMERNNQSNLITHNASFGYFRGSPLLLMEDVAALAPTLFTGPPRLYNKLCEAIDTGANAAGGVAAALYNRGLAAKLSNYRATGALTHAFWDKIIFSKIQARLGGNIRVFITGSAPITDYTKNWLRVCFSCDVIEGYGLTETSSGTSLAGYDDDRTNSHVGIPYANSEIKLIDVKEMDYLSTDELLVPDTRRNKPKDSVILKVSPRGEIAIRGQSIFSGYYNEQKKTEETFQHGLVRKATTAAAAAAAGEDESQGGWFLTGDVGQYLPDGTLKIIDRKKNIFKLSQGEYIAAEKIENIYARCKYVLQIFVYGDSFQSCVVAVVVPDEANIRLWMAAAAAAGKAGAKDHSKLTFVQICALPAVKALLVSEMAVAAAAGKLNSYEKVKDISLEATLFSPENGLLTPTQKLQRAKAKTKYVDVIAAMYAAVNAAESSSGNKTAFMGATAEVKAKL